MMSDRDYLLLDEKVKPPIQALQEEIEILNKEGLNKKSWQEIQRLLKELAPYRETNGFASEWIKEIHQTLEPYWQEIDVLRKAIFMNLFLMVILALVPVCAWLFGADMMVVSMLCLPVLGWGWFGFRGYLKKQKVI